MQKLPRLQDPGNEVGTRLALQDRKVAATLTDEGCWKISEASQTSKSN